MTGENGGLISRNAALDAIREEAGWFTPEPINTISASSLYDSINLLPEINPSDKEEEMLAQIRNLTEQNKSLVEQVEEAREEKMLAFEDCTRLERERERLAELVKELLHVNSELAELFT